MIVSRPRVRIPPTSRREPERGFFPKVYALVRKIPRGRVTTYGSIARALGVPRGARAVGWAMRACGGGIPWHRVVNAEGRIALRRTGGHATQRSRLEREGVRFDREGKIDFERFGWRML